MKAFAVTLGMAAMIVTPPTFYAARAGAQDAKPSFEGFASAYGMDANFSNASIPLGLTPQFAGPTAEARLNNLGNSDAFAAYPYPGDTAAGLPGTAGAVFGVPIPAYPAIVATQAGDYPKDQEIPGVGLHAESGASNAYGRASAGSDGAGLLSEARVEALADQSVRALARSKAGFNVLNFLDLSGVVSNAEVTADSTTGELVRIAHTSIGRISVPGLAIAIPESTPGTVPIPIPIPGVAQLPPIEFPTLPIPSGGTTLIAPDLGFRDGTFTVVMPGGDGKPTTYAVPADSVLKAFEQQGILITYQAAQELTTGVVAPAITFKYAAAAPPPNQYFNGPTDINFTLGRATASVTLNPAQSAFGLGPSGGLSPGIANGVLPGGSVGAVDSAGLPSLTTPALGGLPGTAPVAGAAVGSDLTGPASYAVSAASTGDLSDIYVACLILAALVLLAASFLRLRVVRFLWGS
ncbi:hypothetical protein GCM10009547_28750 [Sporichthya brevicatena]|uniref:Uncharacterized protein n=1 Tax=Sporichthya brevicatena TaxID=171442 RepID=A0ABN1GYS7_9ACTN